MPSIVNNHFPDKYIHLLTWLFTYCVNRPAKSGRVYLKLLCEVYWIQLRCVLSSRLKKLIFFKYILKQHFINPLFMFKKKLLGLMRKLSSALHLQNFFMTNSTVHIVLHWSRFRFMSVDWGWGRGINFIKSWCPLRESHIFRGFGTLSSFSSLLPPQMRHLLQHSWVFFNVSHFTSIFRRHQKIPLKT